jgi:hypothetical protein
MSLHPLYLGWNVSTPLVTQAVVYLYQVPIAFRIVVDAFCQFLVAPFYRCLIVAYYSYRSEIDLARPGEYANRREPCAYSS